MSDEGAHDMSNKLRGYGTKIDWENRFVHHHIYTNLGGINKQTWK